MRHRIIRLVVTGVWLDRKSGFLITRMGNFYVLTD